MLAYQLAVFLQIEKKEVDKSYENYINICKRNPLCYRRDNFVQRMIVKSHINVTKTGNEQPSNCPLIIEGIIPQQQIDLCTGQCSNLTLIDTPSYTGPVPVTGEFSSLLARYLQQTMNCGHA